MTNPHTSIGARPRVSNMPCSRIRTVLYPILLFLAVHVVDGQDATKDFLLVADYDKSTIFMGSLDDFNLKPLSLGNIRAPVAVDYDPVNGMIYWTDYMDTMIIRAHLNGSRRQILVHTELVDPGGLSLDPKSWLMFWTDGRPRRQIERARMDGSDRRTIVSQCLGSPRAIATNRKARHVYWSTWSNIENQGKIERVHYDGSHHVVLVESTTWPNGIALDLKGSWLYWCDAKSKSIERCDLEGNRRELIMSHPQIEPFGLAIYADSLLWTDRNVHSLLQWNLTQMSLTTAGPDIFLRATGIYVHTDQDMSHRTEVTATPVGTVQSSENLVEDDRMEASHHMPHGSGHALHTASYTAFFIEFLLIINVK